MASKLVSWDRLVRYIPADGSADVRYGDPILPDGSTGSEIVEWAEQGKLQVKVLEGSDYLSATPTDRTEAVKALLGPLEPRDVPIVRCIGLNYKSHSTSRMPLSHLNTTSTEALPNASYIALVLETGRPLPKNPFMFTKPGPSVANHGEDIPIPVIAQQQCDYEGELVIVIGKDAKNVNEDEALEYVAGYTAGNDVSARDWQREPEKAGPVPQWSFSKSFDKYAPLGPALVARHILGAADNQSLKTLVNGAVRQEGNTSDLYFGVRKLVAYCSQGQTLQKGSLIMTGTPGGVGLFMKPPAFLKDGDEVVVDIGGIGQLKNRIVFEK